MNGIVCVTSLNPAAQHDFSPLILKLSSLHLATRNTTYPIPFYYFTIPCFIFPPTTVCVHPPPITSPFVPLICCDLNTI